MATITKDQVISFIKENYNEEYIIQSIDEAKPNYLDEDWMDEFEDEEEAYQETGRGEAESEVRTEIEQHILQNFYTD